MTADHRHDPSSTPSAAPSSAAPPPDPPEIFVLAGPNGAGKTTVAGLLLPDTLGVTHFVNADFIARALSPHAPAASSMEAGRRMLRRMHDLRGRRETFGFETTLASKTFAPFLRRARDDGYLVHLVFAYVRNPEVAVQRVRLRVERGGHDVPEPTIRRRYDRGLANFFQLYQPVADSWSVCDNSGESLDTLAHGGRDRQTTVLHADRWQRMLQQGHAHEA